MSGLLPHGSALELRVVLVCGFLGLSSGACGEDELVPGDEVGAGGAPQPGASGGEASARAGEASGEDPGSAGAAGGEAPGAAGTAGAGGVAGEGASEERHRSSPAELTARSAADYADNASGLVHPRTLSRWLADWAGERPTVIEGDLVVLQLGAEPSGLPYVAQAQGVRSYAASILPRANEFAGLLDVRLNGVTAIGLSPAAGVKVDTLLRAYGISPRRDFVLLASGAGAPGDLAVLAKAWLALRYWGFAHEHLGVLHGSVTADLSEAYRAASAASAPSSGTERVPSLGRDHFSLLASLGSVRDAIASGTAFLDVRSVEAFEGNALSAAPTETSCTTGAPSCTASSAGRIPGARSLPLESLLDGTPERLASLEELDEALAPLELDSEQELIVYDDDGQASAIATFALLAVVGMPARWYASSFVEWGSLNASHPLTALRTVPADSPWRTDTGRSIALWANVDRGIRPLVFDPQAPSANALLSADRAYLERPPALPGLGDGGSVCAEAP